jgi:hypothetical protein
MVKVIFDVSASMVDSTELTDDENLQISRVAFSGSGGIG